MAHLYCLLIGLNKRYIRQISEEKSSLLMLNNDCMLNIFKFLELFDYVNLAKTCDRLLNIAISDNKFDHVEVLVTDENKSVVEHYFEDALENNILLSNNEFVDIVSVIGRQLLSIKIYFANDFILQTLSDNCTNLKSVEVHHSLDGNDFYSALKLHRLRNLKEFKISKCVYQVSELEACFINNPDIESLKLDGISENFMELLQLLPKLNKLKLPIGHAQQVQHLLNLNVLTKLSFHTYGNCDNILEILAKKTNLVELKFSYNFIGRNYRRKDIFTILKSFRNLQVLSITNSSSYWVGIPEKTVFPPNLKYIKLDVIWMTCSNILSIVEQLDFLEEMDLGHAAIDMKQFC